MAALAPKHTTRQKIQANNKPSSNPTSNPMPWKMIKDYFEGQWVELTDVEWEWDESDPNFLGGAWHPKRARVRHSASQRHELLSQVARVGRAKDSTILFVSPVKSLVRMVIQQQTSASLY